MASGSLVIHTQFAPLWTVFVIAFVGSYALVHTLYHV